MVTSLVKQEEESICFNLALSEKEKALPSINTETGNPSTQEDIRREQFDNLLIEAIDEALTSLGEPVKNTFYQHLENDFCIKKTEIPQKIDDFSFLIHKIFGLGASRLEIRFVKNLSSKIRVNGQLSVTEVVLSDWIVNEIQFKEHVNEMRTNYQMNVCINH